MANLKDVFVVFCCFVSCGTTMMYSARLGMSSFAQECNPDHTIVMEDVVTGTEPIKEAAKIKIPDGVCEPPTHPERRPELVHIRKTGGSTLEILAASYNMSWGACHWHTVINDMPKGLKCPPSPRHVPQNTNSISKFWGAYRWHIPPKYMQPEDTFWMDGAAPFVVVRNPYDRAVSAWNYAHKKYAGNATRMNIDLMNMMGVLQRNRPKHSLGIPGKMLIAGSEIPQTEYITEGIRILRTEHMEQDFQCMMRGHGYNWEWPRKKSFNKSKLGSLSKANLTQATRAMIARVYHDDFELLGYSKDF